MNRVTHGFRRRRKHLACSDGADALLARHPPVTGEELEQTDGGDSLVAHRAGHEVFYFFASSALATFASSSAARFTAPTSPGFAGNIA